MNYWANGETNKTFQIPIFEDGPELLMRVGDRDYGVVGWATGTPSATTKVIVGDFQRNVQVDVRFAAFTLGITLLTMLIVSVVLVNSFFRSKVASSGRVQVP